MSWKTTNDFASDKAKIAESEYKTEFEVETIYKENGRWIAIAK